MHRVGPLSPPPVVLGIVVTVAVLVPLIVFAVVARTNTVERLGERAVEERLRSATVAARVVDESLRASESDLRSFAGRVRLHDALARGDSAELTRHMTELQASNVRYNDAAVLDLRGRLLAVAPPSDVVGQVFADRDYFIGALATEGPYVSEMFRSRARVDEALVAVAQRVIHEGKTYGVLVIAFAAEEFITLVQGLSGVQGREIVIVDQHSQVLASSGPHRPLQVLALEPLRSPGSATVRVEDLERIATYVPISRAKWTLYVLDDPEVARAIETRFDSTLLIAFAAMVLAAIAMGCGVAYLQAKRTEASREIGHALEAQRIANEHLRRTDQRKDEFVSIVSHEFRTPLTGILGFSEMIRDEVLTTQQMKEYADDINRDALRLARMINDMLDLDRMESGRMSLVRERLDLTEVVEDVVDTVRSMTKRHRIEVGPGMPVDVVGDRDKLTQIVSNLLSNAVKYSPEGGTIRVRTWAHGDRARIRVSDEGIDIPPDQLEHVWEKFARVESENVRDIQGTGLGLPIVKQIAELHGGRVWAESVAGQGSTFHVELPLAHAGAPEAADALPEATRGGWIDPVRQR